MKVAADEYVLGVDGGGTKTHAVIVDGTERAVGEGTAGPSNPLRVGVESAAAAVREAVDKACNAAGIEREQIVGAEIGLAGVRREDVRDRMREQLIARLGITSLNVVTDGEIALYGATDGKSGVVVIAGTGSICCGKNGRGKQACAGGWGPVAGDEGSGSWIARRGLQAVAQALDGRGPATSLTKAVCDCFNISTPDNISTAIYAPSMTNERIARFCRYVIQAALGDTDQVAQRIIIEAGRELGAAANACIRSLRMQREHFQVAYVGGVFAAGELILDPLRTEIARVARNAILTQPQMEPAVAAARMARRQYVKLALVG